MKIKLDENLGRRVELIVRTAGHDVETAVGEGLGGAPDEAVFEACVREKRCLITLDLDFSDPVRFRPDQTAGIAILRLPAAGSGPILDLLLSNLLALLQKEPIAGSLWIVEANRIRIRDGNESGPR